jgi:tetratricopeptide (TPR) repeat protein
MKNKTLLFFGLLLILALSPNMAKAQITNPPTLTDERAGQSISASTTSYTEEQLNSQTTALRAQPQNAALWYARGQTRVQLHDPAGAVSDFTEAIRLEPFKADFYVSRARLLAQQGNWAGVISDATSGLAVAPKHVDLLVLRSRARWNLGEMDAAMADAEKAANIDASNQEAKRAKAWVYLFRGQWPKVIQETDPALQKAPEDVELLLLKGLACSKDGQAQAARACFNGILKVEPKNIIALFNLGKLDFANKNWAAATNWFSKTLEAAPQLPEALSGRGKARLEMDDAAGAQEDLAHAIRIRPDQAADHLWLARACEQLGENARAVVEADRAITLGSKDPRAQLVIARTAAKQAQWETVLAYTSSALEQNPTNTEALALKGQAMAARGEAEPGLEAFGQAIAASPKDWHLRVKRATLLEQQRKWNEAIVECDKAVELNPNALYALSLRAQCNLEDNKPEAALADCEKAIALDPQQAMPLLVRARVRLSQGDATNAVTDCITAIKLMPGSAWGYSTLALALVKQGRQPEAVAVASKALEIAPNDAESFAIRGRALVAMRHYKSAGQDIDRAIELDPALKQSLTTELDELKNRR